MATLKQLREEAGLTAFELASQANVSLSTINRMEHGKVEVSNRIANKVLQVLRQKLGRQITVKEVEGLRVKE